MEMEHENNYGGRATGGLVTGITALGIEAASIAGNVIKGIHENANCGKSEAPVDAVNHYEMALQRELIAKDSEIAYIKGREEAKNDSLELYKYVDGRLRGIEAQISAQAVVNAQITANLSCMQGQIATLNGLTKTVIPITSVCPAPMPQYNSWTAPTATT